MLKWLEIAASTEALFDGSARLVARIVTLAGDGRALGAVKPPSALIVPHAAPAQPGPLSDHAAMFAGCPALVIAAENACVAPNSTVALAGITCTLTSLVTVTAALALLAGAASLVASTWMELAAGMTAGAW
jgi:hypothetical protein